MERAKYQKGEWTILTITDNGITIPARYKTKDWETGWNDKYGCDVSTFEERLYQGLINVMYPPEEDDIDYEAREGYVWVRKDTPDFILGSVIYVAPDDTIENYQQIPEPEEPEDPEKIG